MKEQICICWLRRDLRLTDHAALFHSLKSGMPVLPLFIFDTLILEQLNDSKDTRVTFIYETLQEMSLQLKELDSTLLVKKGTPEKIWQELLLTYEIKAVYANHDYEPYARKRDEAIFTFLAAQGIPFYTFKDQVIFEKSEVIKDDGTPYTVFTPYSRKWQKKLQDFYFKPYPVEKYYGNLFKTTALPFPSLEHLGFRKGDLEIPSTDFESKLSGYEKSRDFPAADATTHIGIHLRFGTISIRHAVCKALEYGAEKWLSELMWREFYMMILWHFPETAHTSFKPAYDRIQWRNKEAEFKAWCEGETGYPLVDAGMKQLNETGFMHNRVRMVTASFLTKHLLIDWRWGEAYFAAKLLDYEMASNIGGWQWACGCGNDAAPYFRVFNPELQARKFDAKNEYIYRWAPAYKQEKHALPLVEHAFARDRMLKAFKEALMP
jgi:deoxyribodipyrimidine photo-lyase